MSADYLHNFLDKLEGVKPTGQNKWLCRCPAHADKSPSMGIKLVDDKIIFTVLTLLCFLIHVKLMAPQVYSRLPMRQVAVPFLFPQLWIFHASFS